MIEYALFYPALCQSFDGSYFITNSLYSSNEEAKKDLGKCFRKLLVEYPPLKLERKKIQ